MKTLQVLEPEKLTPEEVKALRSVGFAVQMTDAEYDAEFRAVMAEGFKQRRWVMGAAGAKENPFS